MLSVLLSGSAWAHTPGLLFIIRPSMALDAAGVPYVAYAEADKEYALSVVKFEGGNWVSATPPKSPLEGMLPSLVLDADGTLSVTFLQDVNSEGIVFLKAAFKGGKWTSAPVKFPGVSLNLPSWMEPPPFVRSAAGTFYIVYADEAKDRHLSAFELEKGAWASVGQPGFSPGVAGYPSPALSSKGILYVAFPDGTKEGRLSVMKFEKGAWAYVGSSGFSPDAALLPSLVLSAAGVPYVAFQDKDNEGRLSVMKFEKGAWDYVGEPGFSMLGAILPSLALSSAGVPYVAYWEYDNTNKGRIVVVKLEGNTWVAVEPPGSSAALKACQTETVERDTSYTRKKCQKAAEQGDAQAQYYVAQMYQYGLGVEEDATEEAKWLKKAAEQGHDWAQFSLGQKYADGKGVARDYAEAMKWYKKAAAQGIHSSTVDELYTSGRWVPQDEAEMVKWFMREGMTKEKEAEAECNVGMAYAKLTEHPNGEKALEWLGKAAEKGYARAFFELGEMFIKGHAIAQDEAEAVKWYKKAAELGYVNAADWYKQSAHYRLGLIFANSSSKLHDDVEAVKWMMLVKKQTEAEASYTIGESFFSDNPARSLKKDVAEGMRWYKKAAELGHAKASYDLATFYAWGNNVAKDEAEAAKWFRKAAEQGHKEAQKAIQRMEKP